jgi:acyl-CoA synthetase (AMP-forming)/AMP-acid ligase II
MTAGQSNERRQIGGYSIRWDSGRAAAAYAEGWWVRETLGDALQFSAAQSPERELLVDGECRLTCGVLYAKARSLAHALTARAHPGSVVSFMLPNWHEAAIIYHAVTLAGMVAHPILPSLRDHELRFMLKDVGSRFIFIPGEFRRHDYIQMMDRVLPTLDPQPTVVVVRDEPKTHVPFEEFLSTIDDGPALPRLEADAVRLVLYTSGTTGTAKGVLHTHNSIHALMRQIRQHWRVDPGDCFLVPSPVSHIGGSIYAFEAPLLLGTRAVLLDRWDPEVALTLAAAERCTHICGATPFLEQLLAAARIARERLPRLKLFVCGGASVPPRLVRDAAQHFDRAAITRVYGSTEVPVTTVGCTQRADLAHAADTDGRPGCAEIRVSGVAAATPADGDGEVLVRGPQMLVGYLHAEHERTLFDADGFYRTGDLGHWVDNDYLVISGRYKDLIIRNGENISPREIEDLLLDHPNIAEVAVVAVPDERTGEHACAVIVPAEPAGPDVAALREFLQKKGVAAFKFPEEVVHWDCLPKSDTGKVLKHKIRAALRDQREGQ